LSEIQSSKEVHKDTHNTSIKKVIASKAAKGLMLHLLPLQLALLLLAFIGSIDPSAVFGDLFRDLF